MNKQITILIFDDSPFDIELIQRQLRNLEHKVSFIHAFDEDSFRAAFEKQPIDLVLADYAVPEFNGMMALLYVQEFFTETPFIFVTGTLNDEERAAQTILNGASGFVLKSNLNRLPEVVMDCLNKLGKDKPLASAIDENIWKRDRIIQKIENQIESNNQALNRARDIVNTTRHDHQILSELKQQLAESNRQLEKLRIEIKE